VWHLMWRDVVLRHIKTHDEHSWWLLNPELLHQRHECLVVPSVVNNPCWQQLVKCTNNGCRKSERASSLRDGRGFTKEDRTIYAMFQNTGDVVSSQRHVGRTDHQQDSSVRRPVQWVRT